MRFNKLYYAFIALGFLVFGNADVTAQGVGTPNGNTSSFFSTNNAGRLLGHREAGTFGAFPSGNQWIGIGQPTTFLSPFAPKVPAYGLRSQWEGQSGIFALKSASGSTKDLVVEWGDNTSSKLKFSFIEDLNNPTALKEIMTISPSGNGTVGIGTTTPFAALDVASSPSGGSVTFGIQSVATGSNFGFYGMNSSVNISSSFFTYGLQSRVTSGSTSYMYGGGFFANNSTTSSSAITYGIYSQASSTSGTVWAGYFVGDVFVSGTINHASDKRFKKDIKTLSSGAVTAKLMELRPATYLYKNDENIRFSKGLQYGFVAQEVEKVFPDLVNDVEQPVFEGTDEAGNPMPAEGKSIKFKSVNYTGLIPVLTKALQEHEMALVAYKAELNAQKAINAELQEKLDQVLSAMELDGDNSAIDTPAATETSLGQNMPNPFGQATEITYSLASTVRNANIQIYNMDGKLLADYKLDKDANSIQLKANEYQPGVYIYVMMADGETIGTRRMIVSQ